jgi:O-antigen/teichoic acid export membrane protein
LALSKLKLLAKDSLYYGISGIVSRMIVVFLVPVYTRIFEPADYGVLNLINTTFFLLGIVSFCALDSAVGRWFYDSSEEEERKKTFASWFWFQFSFTLILIAGLLFSVSFFANQVINVDVKHLRPIWFLACATLITNILPSVIWNWYRLNRKPKPTLLFTISQSLLTVTLTIVFVVVLKMGLFGVYLALFTSSLTFSIIALTQIHSWLKVSYFNVKRIKEMLRYSLPMIPAAAAFWLINSAGTYFLRFLKGDHKEIGLFAVGVTVASGVSLFTGAFQQAWGPFAFSIINEPDAKKTYANVFFIFGVLSSVVILTMFLFSPEILEVFTTSQYVDSSWVASILSVNIILIAFTYIASIGPSIVKNSVFYSVGVMIASAVTILLYIWFIPLWGKEGAALATVLAQLIVPVFLFLKGQKLYPIPYDFTRVAVFLLAAVAIGVLIRLIPFTTTTTAIQIKILALLCFIMAALLYIRVVLKVPLRFRQVRVLS